MYINYIIFMFGCFYFYFIFFFFAAILIVVAIGVALGVFVGGLLLSLAIYYLKRLRLHHGYIQLISPKHSERMKWDVKFSSVSSTMAPPLIYLPLTPG